MNWGLVGWVAGVLLTFAAIKFVFIAIKTLLSKDTMMSAMDAIGDSFYNGSEKFKKYLKKKSKQRTARKIQQNNKPTIIVR